jgi:hypothetical protein
MWSWREGKIEPTVIIIRTTNTKNNNHVSLSVKAPVSNINIMFLLSLEWLEILASFLFFILPY